MPSGSQPSPGKFSRAVSVELRAALARRQVSGAALARLTGRSQTYLSERLRADRSFTMTDLEDICREANIDLLALMTAAARASQAR